jgi:hypothetical protein
LVTVVSAQVLICVRRGGIGDEDGAHVLTSCLLVRQWPKRHNVNAAAPNARGAGAEVTGAWDEGPEPNPCVREVSTSNTHLPARAVKRFELALGGGCR